MWWLFVHGKSLRVDLHRWATVFRCDIRTEVYEGVYEISDGALTHAWIAVKNEPAFARCECSGEKPHGGTGIPYVKVRRVGGEISFPVDIECRTIVKLTYCDTQIAKG